MITEFLEDVTYMEPLNLFLYTWRFLSELEQEERNIWIKNCLKWFARISIWLFPLAFCCIVPAYTVEISYNIYYYNLSDYENSLYYYYRAHALFRTVEILGPVTNLVSCLILALVIR